MAIELALGELILSDLMLNRVFGVPLSLISKLHVLNLTSPSYLHAS